MHNSAIDMLSKLRGITIQESRSAMLEMCFSEYVALLEAGANITPPSGQTIAPTGTTAQTQTSANKPNQAKSWIPGQPVMPGMTVGVNNATGKRIPALVSNVNKANNTVDVTDTTSGQVTTHGIHDLGAIIGNNQPAQTNQPNQAQQPNQQMSEELKRMRQLAGIAEDASCGASGAGGIAVAPMPMGKVKRRQAVDEVQAKEYTPTVAKTVAGDTKPFQASGELSATLAANGKKTASRTNNGIKR